MAAYLKSILDKAETAVKFDDKLIKSTEKYVNALMNRNEDHVHFFGSNLTGVYPLRFKTSDRNEWFVDIKDIDEHAINDEIVKMSKLADSDIKPTWVRATDAFNMDMLYTAHRYMNSSLPEKDKEKACFHLMMALNIKLLSSLMAAYFKYDCDERVALEVYSRLSRKFNIKRLGNWRKVLENRSRDIYTGPKSWFSVIKNFNSDADIAQCISDIQGRLRSMVKYIWEVLDKVMLDNARVLRTSMVIDTGGETMIRELSRNPDKYLNYSTSILIDQVTFIKPEILEVLQVEMPTLPMNLFDAVLGHLVLRSHKNEPEVEEMTRGAVEFAIGFIQADRTSRVNARDFAWIMNRTKALFTASKTNNPLVFRLQELSLKHTRASANTRNDTLLKALRTGLIMYIIGRTFAMHTYES